jgi:glycerol-3-phosphate acyltransferase PlsY
MIDPPMIALALGLSYLLGSIPTGLWLGRALRGIDIREHGSKNIGATNTLRVLGKPLGAAALAGDMLKGAIPVLYFGTLTSDALLPIPLPLACGIAAILGHSFSLFLRFQGGKGVATSAGVFFALLPVPTLIAAVVFGITVWRTRMVSLGSILAAITLTVVAMFSPVSFALHVIVLLVASLVIWKHRSNIGRIIRGEENKF